MDYNKKDNIKINFKIVTRIKMNEQNNKAKLLQQINDAASKFDSAS
jgi:hypothetical protein